MSEAKHTPGPWMVTGHGAGKGMISHQTGNVAFTAFPRDVVEDCEDGESWIDMRERTQPERDRIHAEKMANAHLIAAAPEMLAAMKGPQFRTICDRLEALIAFYVEKVGPDYEEIAIIRQQINDIKSAIAKAEGRS